MLFGFGKQARRQRLKGTFPAAWLPYLDEGVLYFRLLDPQEQARLRDAAHVLIVEKNWEGCAGQEITDEIKVVVAAQAAILLLGREDYFFDDLDTVLVYPGSFLGGGEDGFGRAKQPDMRMGEAMRDGPVALAWWHVRWAGRRLAHFNVVLHEFAHKLAELGDPDTSRPPFLEKALWPRWDRVMNREREQLAEDDDYGRPTLIDPYGATDPHEFFAVATETFFLRSAELRDLHPDVYELLAACYRQDPARRTVPPEVQELARGAEDEYSRHAIRECTAALKDHPDYLEAYHTRAEHRLALDDRNGALEDYAAIIERSKGAEKAEALFDRAQLLDEMDRTDEAIADLTAAVTVRPDYAAALGHRGHLLAGRGDLDAALRDLDAAVKLDKRDDLLRRWRSELHRRAGRLDLALKDVEKAIRLYGGEPGHYLERARVRLAMGDVVSALADCDEALRLDPDEDEAQRLREEVLAAKKG
jgi:Mlc titration factor MtfA (ptsG expression regulator)